MNNKLFSYIPKERTLLYIFVCIFFFFFITIVILNEQVDHWQRQYDLLQYQTSQKSSDITPTEKINPYFYHVFERFTSSGKYKVKLEYNLGLTSSSPCEAKASLYTVDGHGPLSYNEKDGWRLDYLFFCPTLGDGSETPLFGSTTNPTFDIAKDIDAFYLNSPDDTNDGDILYVFNDQEKWKLRQLDIIGSIATTSAALDYFVTEKPNEPPPQTTSRQFYLYDNNGKNYDSLSIQEVYLSRYTRVNELDAAVLFVPIKEDPKNENNQTASIYLADFQKKKFILLGEANRTLMAGPPCKRLSATYSSGQLEIKGECLDKKTVFSY